MHSFLEKIRATVASMSVKDSKVTAARPSAFEIGFSDIHDDGDSVFVVVLDQSVISID